MVGKEYTENQVQMGPLCPDSKRLRVPHSRNGKCAVVGLFSLLHIRGRKLVARLKGCVNRLVEVSHVRAGCLGARNWTN